MSRRSLPAMRALGLALTVAMALGACSNPSHTAGPSGPTGSGAAACQTAPSVSDDLAGWGSPTEPPEFTPLLIVSAGQLVCGPNRILFTLIDKDNRPAGAPDRSVKVDVYNLGRDPEKPIASLDSTFVWAIEDERGDYIANVTFPEAGRYGAAFTIGTADPIRLTFDVQPSSAVVKVGEKAPASKTPTLADVGGDVTHISTDTSPDPRLYSTSLDAALAEHKPVALVFATPKFCVSQQCGPTLDRLKPFVDRYPTVTFINVEPYKLELVDGSLQPVLDANNFPQLTAVSEEWHLIVEPTLYVIDREGMVTANFDLIFSDDELTAALDAVK